MSQTGFVNLIKPTGMTSSDVVLKVKKALGTKKVGHLGTLDPAASGVLPIAVGKATKFFDYFLNKDKVYVARVIFGVETDTLDSFGTIVKKDDKKIDIGQIQNVLKKFVGEISQTPPKYSAVKVHGKRAYDLARQGENFEISAKKIKIYSIDVQKTENKNEFLFVVNCSAGTYIRTLMSDIAREIDGICTTFVIIRTKSGVFDINDALTLEEFENSKKVFSVTEVLKDLSQVKVDEFVFKKLSNGVKLEIGKIEGAPIDGSDFFAVYQDKPLGLYSAENGKFIQKVFLLEE